MVRSDIHEALGRNTFDHAVICTFTFDPNFFENYCLDRLKSLSENGNVSVILDRRIYDEILAAPPSEWPRLANLRYLLHPISVPGIFHPKLFLFASKEKGLLIVGSANFSKAGLTTNAELVGVYRYESAKDEQHLALFQQAVQFLLRLADSSPGDDLQGNLRELLVGAPWLSRPSVPATPGPSARLIHNLDRSIWEQVCDGVQKRPTAFHAVSRYFDATPAALTRVIRDLNAEKYTLWTQNGLTTLTPDWVRHPAVRNGAATVKDIAVDDDSHPQPLHAKALAVIAGDEVRLAFGSANFTHSGLFSTSQTGNCELMIVIDGLSTKVCKPERLFDPCGSAAVLTDPLKVRTAPKERHPRVPSPPIELLEATLTDQVLACRVGEPPSGLSEWFVILSTGDGGQLRVPLSLSTPALLVATVDSPTAERCAAGATVVHLEAAAGRSTVLASNRLFLLNLQDVETGRSKGRERRVREAQRSATLFAAMLDELLQLNETDTLQNFLTHCDIPVINAERPFDYRRARPQHDGDAAINGLGQGNLRAYASLHEAAIGFCERHTRRMRRHCSTPSVAGVPNFMHIALAIGNVLWSQSQRALVGLESADRPLSAEDWYEHRQRLGQYASIFHELSEILYGEYVPALEQRFRALAIQEAIKPDLEAFVRLCTLFMGLGRRLEACRVSRIRVRTPMGDVITPKFFHHDIFAEARWTDWCVAVRASVQRSQAWMKETA
ncbi:MAG: phospholipase D-like domain-containing protein [Acidobacteriota bacterium]|nr:phospholipase D-like domain-containing protein [Acidobacteriota bacterium]